jgi:hypothetical protein
MSNNSAKSKLTQEFAKTIRTWSKEEVLYHVEFLMGQDYHFDHGDWKPNYVIPFPVDVNYADHYQQLRDKFVAIIETKDYMDVTYSPEFIQDLRYANGLLQSMRVQGYGSTILNIPSFVSIRKKHGCSIFEDTEDVREIAYIEDDDLNVLICKAFLVWKYWMGL